MASHKSQKSHKAAKPHKHHLSKKRRLILGVFCAVMALFGLALVAFITSKPFREKVDALYFSVYAALYVDPAFNDIATTRKNIAYCGSASRFQKLDMYLPKQTNEDNTTEPVPAVIYVHGGGWAVGDKASTMLTRYGTEIVKNGMALVSINYRLAPDYMFPTQNQDVACALEYLKNHAAELRIGGQNIGLWGDSAGGQLAAMTALNPKYKPVVGAVVEFYGTADLWAQISNKSKADLRAIAYLGSSKNQTRARQASPLYGNLTGAPPFLLFHGTDDHTVTYGQSVAFEKKLRAAGADVTLRTVKQADHNFTDESQPTADQIKTEMTSFFKQHLVR